MECVKCFAKFCAGDFSLDDRWWGRSVEVDSYQIETLIENSQHYTTWEMADILKISKSVKLLVKMKNVSLILWKKLNGCFGQRIIHTHTPASNNTNFFFCVCVEPFEIKL